VDRWLIAMLASCCVSVGGAGGLVNTPSSVMNMAKGRQWDPLRQRWIR
jgi:hypothetical protein